MKNTIKVLLVVLVVLLIARFYGNNLDENSTTNELSSENVSLNEDAKLDETQKEEITFFSVDNMEQSCERWKMTYKECQIKNKLDSFTIAKDGTEFVVVFFEIENISEERQVFSLFGEEFYLDGVKTAQTLYGMTINKSFQLTSIPVEPGRKANGYFLFQVSPDWQELEIICRDSLFEQDGNNVMRFTLTRIIG